MPRQKLGGVQPARAHLQAERYTTRQAATAIAVDYTHLMNAIAGKVRPNPRVREHLPLLLGVPIAELFEPELLRKPYDEDRGKGDDE